MDAHGIVGVSNDLGEAGGGGQFGVGAVQGSPVVGVAASPAVVDLSDDSYSQSVIRQSPTSVFTCLTLRSRFCTPEQTNIRSVLM